MGKKEEISFRGLINWLPRKQGFIYQGCLYKVFRWVSFFACYLLNNGIRYFIKGKYIVPLFWCLITLCTVHCAHTRIVRYFQCTAFIMYHSNWKINVLWMIQNLDYEWYVEGHFWARFTISSSNNSIQNFPTGTLDPGLLGLCYWYCTTIEGIFSSE